MTDQQQDHHQKQIDELLERYLSLLDTYSSLRQKLSKLQSGIYQSIARANFVGERGMRYGRDHYDERMRALRVLDVEIGEEGVPIFRIREAALLSVNGGEDNDDNHEGDDGGDHDQKEETNCGADFNDNDAAEIPATETPKKKTKKSNNPLYWFGLFAPPALRTAQSHAILAVEDIIPRLLSVNAEMASVEIQVRRVRKRRAKVALAAEKEALAASSDGPSAEGTVRS